MASVGTVESGTLDWVKTEIDQTLGHAREALLEFIANTDDLTYLRMYANHLHQVVGTLQMVELDGAAMLAKETESLVDDMIHNGPEHDVQHSASLLDSSLQDLSLYLDKLQKGMADMPIHNLESMNKLRQARGEGPIEIFSIFTPDLEVYPPKPEQREKLEDAEYKDRIAQIRKQFQVALLRWLRDADNSALRTIGELTKQLQNIARFNSVAQLWWVARAYIEVLADEASDLGATQKHIPARLDQLLRKLIEGGEAAIAKDRDENLIKQMLYDIGVYSTNSAAVMEIQHAFNLNEILRGEIKEQPFRSIPPALGRELETELGSIKENITDYFDSPDREPERLDQIVQGLRSVATRVEQEGSSNLVELVTEVVNVLNLAGTQVDGMDEHTIALQVAESLILLEEILKSKSDLVEDWPQSVSEKIKRLRSIREHSADATDAAGLKVARLATADMKNLLPVVANEIYVNLHAAEEALEAFSRRPEETTTLEGVPDNLAQVQGALQILGQHKAADMLSTASDYLEKLINKELEPTHALIDALAVAIVTAQSFMEGLEKDRPYTREMVDRAIQDLEDVLTERELINFDPAQAVKALREHLEKWLSDNANYAAFRQLRQCIKEISAVASIRKLSKPRRIAREMNNLLDIVTEDPSFLSEEVGQTLRRSLDTLEELVVDLEASVTLPEDSSIAEEVEEEVEVQTEILEIFREEAEECAENIEQFFTLWREDTTNESALIDLRRQFHTLKGSGRTANAGPFAELAWIVEHLLNRVIDHKLEASEDLIKLLSDAKQTIVELLKDKAFGASWLDLKAWEDRSQGLLEREKHPVPTVVEISKPHDAEDLEQEAGKLPDLSAGAQLDDAVVRIFTQETLGHINTIRDFLSNQVDTVSPDLIRAVHTLRGTSRSLHLVEMSNVFLALDEHLNSVHESRDSLSQLELDLLDKAALLSAKTLDRLNTDKTFPAALRSEFDGLRGEIANCQRPGEDLSEEDNISALGKLMSQRGPQRRATPSADGLTSDTAVDDDALLDLKDIFCEESIDVLTRINNALDEWRDGQEEAAVIPKIKRDLHTLKGSARTAGYDAIGDLSHLTETLLEKEEKGFSIEENLLRVLLEEAHDTLSEMVNQVEQGDPVKQALHLKQRMSELVVADRDVEKLVPTADDSIQTTDRADLDAELATEVSGLAPAQQEPNVGAELSLDSDKDADEVESGRNVLRINTDILDKLVNYAGEVSITRAQLQEQLGGLRANLVELRGNISRFSEQLRRLDLQADSQIRARFHERQAQLDSDSGEFDPLQLDRYTELQQLSRSLSESLDDLVTIQTDISKIIHQSESVMQQQAQLSAELQDGLMSARLVPFSTLIPKLRHQARQTARELDKKAQLRMTGGGVEIDRKVLDGMAEALDHMIRNALYHGIEDPSQRKAKGKPEAGTILIECKHQGNEAIIRFSDDGAGLNVDEIRSKAIDRGLVRDKASLSDQEIIQLIVLPGFSTAAEVTQVSGRGVGMDVVHSAVRRLGGSITVESEPGQGTAFVVVLPLSLSITQAIFVRCGSQEFAVSLNVIQNVMKVDREELESMSSEGEAVFEQDGREYPLMDLSKRLHITDDLDNEERVPILIVRMGASEVAVKVGKLMGTQEVVVKPLGNHVAHMDGIAGATIRGNGTVVLILDLAELWLADDAYQEVAESESVPVEAPCPPLIMVVDDSLTVRKVTARNLSRHGMEVVMAKDGVDALDHVNKRLPDLMLVDIEMPRMDGYELTKQIRSDPATKDIPIVIITSRAGTKHKEKALSLGANDYLTKPYQEDELVSHVQACLSESKVGAGIN